MTDGWGISYSEMSISFLKLGISTNCKRKKFGISNIQKMLHRQDINFLQQICSVVFQRGFAFWKRQQKKIPYKIFFSNQ